MSERMVAAAIASLLISSVSVAVAQTPAPSAVAPPSAMRPSVEPHKSSEAKLSANDRKFLTEAAEGGMMEIEAGHLASSQAVSPDVKGFGERIATDHTAAGNKLKTLASQKGMTLPSAPGPDEQRKVDALRKVKGKHFDRHYARMMVKDHEEDIAAFKRAAQGADDSDVRAYAAATLPTLEDHLKQAKSLAKGSPATH